jgi:hypothetical protein
MRKHRQRRQAAGLGAFMDLAVTTATGGQITAARSQSKATTAGTALAGN